MRTFHLCMLIGATSLAACSPPAYLLRPDQHVCARWLALDARRLQSALDNATCTQGAQA